MAERHLVLEGVDDGGAIVVGRARAGLRDVRVLDHDPELPALRPLLDAPGGPRLRAHRFGRRAVLHEAGPEGGTWVKLATPAATRAAFAALHRVDRLLADRPGRPGLVRVLAADPDAGTLRLAAAPGSDLTTILTSADPVTAGSAGAATGRALAVLAGSGTGEGWPEHDLTTEARTLRRWADDALAFGVLSPAMAGPYDDLVARTVEELVTLPRRESVPAHRDLHDGQVLLDPRDGGVTFLDVDTAALADPALDPANLLAHLDLLALRRPGCGTAVAAAVRGLTATLTGPRSPEHERVLRRAAQLRILAVHAFRGPVHDLAPFLDGSARRW
ncbi:phosphotransferase [Kineococcus gynurae]|uniref:Phosphotransferase n=1 Tax=Kineococcus gynurae TaxID=452979 RepID=A0ABV5LXD0_9ACTN